jgi:3-hydroxyisobutyrate dehydrogenase-like beta-hydroxyacid dehydrogenase
MATTDAKLGFVGLGHMGGNTAARLLAAGYTVYGEAQSRESAKQLIHEGLEWCESARSVSQAADVVFTSLPDDHVIEEVATGTDGLLAGLGPEKIWLDMSTVSPRVSRELAAKATERGATMLDAPVSGSVPQVGGRSRSWSAATRTRTRASSRSSESSARRRSSETTGKGSRSKLAINISLAVQMLAFAEGLLLAKRSGVDPQRALDVMEVSPIGSPMLRACASGVRSRSSVGRASFDMTGAILRCSSRSWSRSRIGRRRRHRDDRDA